MFESMSPAKWLCPAGCRFGCSTSLFNVWQTVAWCQCHYRHKVCHYGLWSGQLISAGRCMHAHIDACIYFEQMSRHCCSHRCTIWMLIKQCTKCYRYAHVHGCSQIDCLCSQSCTEWYRSKWDALRKCHQAWKQREPAMPFQYLYTTQNLAKHRLDTVNDNVNGTLTSWLIL